MKIGVCVVFSFSITLLLHQGCRKQPPAEQTGPTIGFATDALGTRVCVQEYPRRIVSMAPSNTEILLALGLRERLIGVTSFYGGPNKVEGIAKIGGYTNPSVSKIISLQPDMVFAARGNPRQILDQLRRHGLKVFTLDTKTVAGLLDDIKKIAELTGTTQQARDLIAEIQREVLNVQHSVGRLSEHQKPTVLWIAQEQPLRTAGPGSLVDELIRIAGGKNVAADEKSPWPIFNMEKLVLQDPQVIVLAEDLYKGSPDRVPETLARFRRQAVWRNISAVKAGRVYYIPTDLLGQPCPAFVRGLKILASYLHPDLFPQVSAERDEPETEKPSD